METEVPLTVREERRVGVIEETLANRMTVRTAAGNLRLSERQVYRIEASPPRSDWSRAGPARCPRPGPLEAAGELTRHGSTGGEVLDSRQERRACARGFDRVVLPTGTGPARGDRMRAARCPLASGECASLILSSIAIRFRAVSG